MYGVRIGQTKKYPSERGMGMSVISNPLTMYVGLRITRGAGVRGIACAVLIRPL